MLFGCGLTACPSHTRPENQGMEGVHPVEKPVPIHFVWLVLLLGNPLMTRAPRGGHRQTSLFTAHG